MASSSKSGPPLIPKSHEDGVSYLLFHILIIVINNVLFKGEDIIYCF